MKNLIKIVILLSLIISNTFAQSCIDENYLLIKEIVTETVSLAHFEPEYTTNVKQGEKILFVSFFCDTNGKVKKVKKITFFDNSVTKRERKAFCSSLIATTFKICNPEPEQSFEDYLKSNNNMVLYNILVKKNE